MKAFWQHLKIPEKVVLVEVVTGGRLRTFRKLINKTKIPRNKLLRNFQLPLSPYIWYKCTKSVNTVKQLVQKGDHE